MMTCEKEGPLLLKDVHGTLLANDRYYDDNYRTHTIGVILVSPVRMRRQEKKSSLSPLSQKEQITVSYTTSVSMCQAYHNV